MSGEKTDGEGQKTIAMYVQECKMRGITILPPDINNGVDSFIPVNGAIQFKLNMIGKLGDSAIQGIENIKPIKSFDDFLERRVKKEIRNDVVVNLIKAGCFDFTGKSREILINELEMHERKPADVKKGLTIPIVPYDERIKAQWEYDALGFYLSKHPLEVYDFENFNKFNENQRGVIGGWVKEIRVVKDKKRNDMAFITLETAHGFVSLIAFSKLFSEYKLEQYIASKDSDTVYLIEGVKSGNSFLIDEMEVCRR